MRQTRLFLAGFLALGLTGCGDANLFYAGASATESRDASGSDAVPMIDMSEETLGVDTGFVTDEAFDVNVADTNEVLDREDVPFMDTFDAGEDVPVQVDVLAETTALDTGFLDTGMLDTGFLDTGMLADTGMPMDRMDSGIPDVPVLIDTPDVPDVRDVMDVVDARDAVDVPPADVRDVPVDRGPDVGCAAGESRCGTACVNTQTNVANCGGCGQGCIIPPPNTITSCAGGTCRNGCQNGFGDCDTVFLNGCEVHLFSSTAHCGQCGRPCRPLNAIPFCFGGACTLSGCQPGFGSCDGNDANGCETTVSSDTTHCGRCGNVCPVRANADPTCTSSVCGFACRTGFGNCDANEANGCEATLTTSSTHCGRCGNVCNTATRLCENGACVSDLVVEYVRSFGIPPANVFPDIYIAFQADGFQPTPCAGGVMSLGSERYRCSAPTPLSTTQVATSLVVMGIVNGCGLLTERTCPPTWPDVWSVRWRGTVYTSRTTVMRRTGSSGPAIEYLNTVSCGSYGFSFGCVGFYPPAP